MNRDNGNNYIRLQEGTMLLNSTTIYNDKNYSFLIEELKKNNGVFPKENLNLLNVDEKNLMNESLLNDLYEETSKEWQYVETIYNVSKEDSNCSLCGQKIKNGTIIVNKFNNKRFVVGSDCAQTYRNLKHTSGKSYKEMIEEQKNTNTIRTNKVYLENNIPGISNNINRYRDFEKYLDTFVSNELKKRYDTIYSNLYTSYEKYIHSRKKDKKKELFKLINNYNEKLEVIKIEMNNYAIKSKNEEWPITKEIKEWCEANEAQKAICFIREDGKITHRIIYCTFEKNLVKQVVEKINMIIEKTGFYIKEYQFNTQQFILKNKRDKRINLIITYKDIVGILGREVVENISFDGNEKEIEILNDTFIEDYNSYYYCCLEIDKLIKKFNMTIFTDNIDLDNNTMYINDYINNRVYVCKLKEFIKKYIKLIIIGNVSQNEINDLYKFIKSSKSETLDEYNERKEISKEFYKKY